MRDERGSAAVELVLATPVLIALMLLAVAGGRLTSSRADVDAAARDGARAASIARGPAAAQREGTSAAEASLAEAGLSCADLTVTIDAAAFRPGGIVAATVSCGVDLSDLTLIALPGTRTISARFTQPVDVYRGVSHDPG